jgi:L-threonylcarbamoyladenylate synthase
MKFLPVNEENIRIAAAALRAGRLVAFPTETVYGLGADGFNTRALAGVFAAKGRPRFDPLILHIADLKTLETLADLSSLSSRNREMAELLTGRFWPGPLTLIFPKQPAVPDLATSGLSTAAIRFPSHPAARALIEQAGCPVAAPSANPFGYLSPTRAEHVRDGLGERVDIILDGGRTPVGVESTVLDLSGEPCILRHGGIPREAIEALIGPVVVGAVVVGPEEDGPEAQRIRQGSGTLQGSISPGLLKSHYAPAVPLSLYAPAEMAELEYAPSEAFLFFSPQSRDAWLTSRPGRRAGQGTAPEPQIRVLSETGNILEAAANLFDLLHELDSLGFARIRAEMAPLEGLGLAINDRLGRAAKKQL